MLQPLETRAIVSDVSDDSLRPVIAMIRSELQLEVKRALFVLGR